MGACYSKKASGGNRPYTTLPMASTKLDEASRLARPTPYARTQNANLEYGVKKSNPMSAKYSSFGTIDHGDIKNLKNTFQSNIPRFSSSLPASTSVEQKAAVINCNDNETLHVVNNNPVANSHSVSNIPNTMSTPVNKLAAKTESHTKPKTVNSKSCPDKIVSPDCEDEKGLKTPGKTTGLPRQMVAKSSHNISQINHENLAIPKSYQSKINKNLPCGYSPLTKSPSQKGSESRDSLSDFDSGIGNSLTDKQRPEDSDTVKDLERLELLDDSSPTSNVDSHSVRSMYTPKGVKANVRAPAYKREPNGKWSFDEKNFTSETEEPVNSKASNAGDRSPREKHSFKINASENIFSTYASYKGLLSYQKKSFKPIESALISKDNLRQGNSSEKLKPAVAVNSPAVSCIPKIRKQPNQPLTNRSSIFYVQNETEKTPVAETEKVPFGSEDKSPTKQQTYSSKQCSVDSDERSDSTENGVLSPPSESENREFLIDDEISDQPDLTLCCDQQSEDSDLQSLQLAVSELHALQLASSSKKRTDSVSSYSSRKSRATDQRDSLVLGSDLGSSCSSIASDDLMLDYDGKSFDGFPEGTVNEGPASPMRKIETDEDKVAPLRTDKRIEFEEKSRKRLYRRSSGPFASSSDKLEWRQRTVSLPLRPPRQMSISEADDGSLKLDSSSYRLLCQDLNGVKTLLLRLKSVIQEAETINPFDQANPKNIFYHSLVHNDFPSSFITDDGDEQKTDISSISQENADLRRQLVLLQTQLEEKDHTIHLLQQQMTKYLNYQGGFVHNSNAVNAATQTDRGRSLTSSLSSSSSSADDSIETLVSVQDDFEKSFRKKSEEQDHLSEHLKEVARLLDHKSSPSYTTDSEC